MARHIPSPLAMRYHQLGTATLVFFIMTIIISRDNPHLFFLNQFGGLFGDGFLLLFFLYAVFEIHNIRTYRRMSYPVYSFDSRGIYQDGVLVADWYQVSGVNVSFFTVKRNIPMGRIEDTTNLFVTRAPLDNLMLLSKKDHVTTRTKVSRIIVSTQERVKRDSYLTIGTTTFKPLVKWTYRSMLKCVRSRSLDINFQLHGI